MGKLTCLDIETDGLYDEATTIYCMSYTHDGEKIETLTRLPDMVDLLKSSDYVVGHSISQFDLLVIKKLLGYYPSHALVIDTLWLSWVTSPNEVRHGLEDWGNKLGVKKVEVNADQWAEGDLELMIHRCQEDVKINWLLWEKQRKFLEQLYG